MFTKPNATPAETEAIRRLAEAAIGEKLARTAITSVDPETGRVVMTSFGEAGPHEKMWDELRAHFATEGR